MLSYDINIHVFQERRQGKEPTCTRVDLSCRKCGEKFRAFSVPVKPDNITLQRMDDIIGESIRNHTTKHLDEINGGQGIAQALRRKFEPPLKHMAEKCPDCRTELCHIMLRGEDVFGCPKCKKEICRGDSQ